MVLSVVVSWYLLAQKSGEIYSGGCFSWFRLAHHTYRGPTWGVDSTCGEPDEIELTPIGGEIERLVSWYVCGLAAMISEYIMEPQSWHPCPGLAPIVALNGPQHSPWFTPALPNVCQSVPARPGTYHVWAYLHERER